MKDYKKILDSLDVSTYTLIEHEWGQNPSSVYNQIVSAINALPQGASVFVLTRKKFGMQSMLKFLKEKGLEAVIVGKGQEDVRMIEFVKEGNTILSQDAANNFVDFEFAAETYHAKVGNAVFSKGGLDEGTRFLLETVFAKVADFSEKNVGDLGAGWGAISLVLARRFDSAKIFSYEREIGAYEALEENMKDFKNVKTLKTDLTKKDNKREIANRTLDYIISNFSFHISEEERKSFFDTAHKLLKPRGEIFFVTEGRFVEWFEKSAQTLFRIVGSEEYKGYKVFHCKK